MQSKREQAKQLFDRGMTLVDEAQPALGIRSLTAAVELYSEHGTRHEHADALRELAHANVDVGDLKEATRLFESASQTLQGEPEGRLLALILLDLARLLTKQERSSEAEPHARAALDLFRDKRLDDWVASALIALGECSEPTVAPEFFKESLEIRKRLSDSDGALVALTRLGSLAVDMQEPQEALDFFTQAIELPDAKSSQGFAHVLNQRGLALRLLGRVAEALDDHCRAEEFQRATAAPGLSSSLNNVALCMEELGRIDEAIGYMEESVRLLQRENEPSLLAISLENLADMYRVRGDSEKANRCVSRANRIRSKLEG